LSALRLELRPSAPLAAAIVAVHAAAGVAFLAVLPGVAGLLGCIALSALGIAAARSRALLRASSSARVLEIEGTQLTLELRDGRRSATQAPERRHASRFLVIIPGSGAERRTLLVVPGMLEAGSFRRLRVWALWGRFPCATPRSVAEKQLPA
jgi:toxin CptA